MRSVTEVFNMSTEEIIERYPFVTIYDIDDFEPEVSTWLDCIPFGWLISFGKMMCEEIREVAIADNCLDKIRTFDVKEKFGELRWYMSYESEEVDNVIEKYSALSGGICMTCGRPDVRVTRGWIAPICFRCWNKIRTGSMDERKYIDATDKYDMPNAVNWRSYNPKTKKWENHRRRIDSTANRIRDNWRRTEAFSEE